MTNSSDRPAWMLSALGVILTFLVLNLNLMSMRRIFKWDAWDLFWPMFRALADSVAQGRLPLWDPRPCCGFPFHADPQAGVFYPVSLAAAYLFGGSFQVFQYLWLMHWLCGVVGFLFLLKRLRVSAAAAYAGTILFGFNGFFLGEAQHTVCVITVSYIPWVLCLLMDAYKKNILYAFPAGVLFGFTGLGGHPGMTIYSAIMIALWCVLQHEERRRVASILFIAFLVGLIVLSPAYGSFLIEGKGYTDRAGYLTVREACNVNRFPFDALISLVAPALTVTYPSLFNVEPGDTPMLNGYFGILGVLSLVATVATKSLRKRWAWLLWFMLTAFLLSMGTVGGLMVIGYYVVPPLWVVRHSSMVRLFWMMGGCVVAGLVFDRLTCPEEGTRAEMASLSVKVLWGLLCLCFCVLVTAWLVPEHAVGYGFPDRDYAIPNSFSVAFGSVGFQFLVVILLLLCLFFRKRLESRKLVIPLLVSIVVLDVAFHLHTNKETVSWNNRAGEVASQLDGLSQVTRTESLNVHSRIATPPGVILNMWPFDNRCYVRGYLAPTSANYDALVGSSWPPYKETRFLHVLEASERFWLTPTVQYCRDDDRTALMKLRDTDKESPVPVFLHSESAGKSFHGGDPVKPGSYGHVSVLSYEPEVVVLLVRAPKDCWLFAAERYAFGWKAFVAGKEIRLEKSNFCFRACRVPQGEHTIKMEYSPAAYRPLLMLSWGLTLAVVGSWMGVCVRHGLRSRRR